MTSGSASGSAASLSPPVRAPGPLSPAQRVGAALPGAVIVTALALVVRLSTLTVQSLWLDEAYTDHLVHLGFGSMLSTIPKTESTPPLYYMIVWGWTHIFGYSEFALRSVSALAGAAIVTVGYVLAGRLGGHRAAVIAGVLLALSPLMIWFSQEARAYSLATLLATGTVLCVIRYLDTLDGRWLAGWAATAALGVCTHYFVAFIVAPELVLLIWRRRSDRRVQVALALVIVVMIALVPLALAQRGTGHADYIAQGSLATRTAQVPKQFLVGYASPSQVLTAGLAALIVAVGALWPLVRDFRRLDRSIVIVLVIGLCGVLVPFALALVGVDFLDTRNVLVALPAVVAVLAVGFAAPTSWPRGGILAGCLALLFAVIVLLVDTNPQYQRVDWRGASSALGAAAGPRAIVVTPGSALLPLQAYESRIVPLASSDRVRELDVIGMPSQSTGSGLGAAPRPAPPFSVPPQFHLIRAIYNRVFTVLRFRSAQPVTVSPALLDRSYIGSGPYAILVQTPARRSR